MASRLMFATIIVCLIFNFVTSDDEKEVEDVDKASFGDAVGESFKGVNNWFKGMAGEAQEKAADGMDVLKTYSAVAMDKTKEKAEDGMDVLKTFSGAAMDASQGGAKMVKGWAEGVGDHFGKAKEKLSETGDKMKEVLGDAMLNTKEELESAASKMTNYAKDATGSMFKLLG